MKKLDKNTNKYLMAIKIALEEEIDFCNVLKSAIYKYDAKKLIGLLTAQYFSSCVNYENTFGKLSENSEAAWVLFYAIKHWDELKEKGKKYYEEKKEKFQK